MKQPSGSRSGRRISGTGIGGGAGKWRASTKRSGKVRELYAAMTGIAERAEKAALKMEDYNRQVEQMLRTSEQKDTRSIVITGPCL